LILLDTHAWAWSLSEPQFLSARAHQALQSEVEKTLSAVTFYEITQKVRLNKWPQMATYLNRLTELANEQSLPVTPLTAEIALIAGQLDWLHRDPFDRMLAATALHSGMDLLSIDPAFDAVPGLRRIW
jgi:PIN domain nuclease of toxin-antitoxin system